MGSFPGVAHSLVTSMSRRFEGDMAALDDGELGSTGGPEGNTLVAISVGWILSICADGSRGGWTEPAGSQDARSRSHQLQDEEI